MNTGVYIGVQTYTHAMQSYLQINTFSISDEEAWSIKVFRPVFQLLKKQDDPNTRLPDAIFSRARERATRHINYNLRQHCQSQLTVQEIFDDPDSLLESERPEYDAQWRIFTNDGSVHDAAMDLAHIEDDTFLLQQLRRVAFAQDALLAVVYPVSSWAHTVYVLHSPFVMEGIVYPQDTFDDNPVASPPLDPRWQGLWHEQGHLERVPTYVLPLELFVL